MTPVTPVTSPGGLDVSKLAPPPSGAGFIERDLVPEGTWPPVLALVAGPGHGKTLGLLGIAARARARGLTPCWLRLDELDGDPGWAFQHLCASVRQHVPSFGEQTAAVLASGQADARLAWQAFLRELAAFNWDPGILLLLDDVHHAAAMPDWLRALGLALERLPAGVHVALASRRQGTLPLGRLAARGLAVVLGPAELRFSAREAAGLWRAHGHGAPPADLREVVERYEGWPLGVGYAAARGSRPEARGMGPASPALTRYIAEEIVEAQAPAARAFMLRAALLHAPGLELAAAVGLAGAADHVEELAAAHALGWDEAGGFHFPAYVREALRTEAARKVPEAERHALHAAAAAFHLGRDELELALAHQLDGGDVAGALGTLRRLVPVALARGQQARVERWLRRLPAAAADGPWPSFWRALVAWRAGDLAAAHPGLERARQGFRKAGDAAGELKAVVRLLTHAVAHADPAAAALRAEAAAAIAHAEDADRADLALADALAAENRADWRAWQAANEQVLALPIGEDIEVAQCAAIARLNLSTIALMHEELATARAHAVAAEALAARWGFAPDRLFASFMIAHLQVLAGQVADAAWFLRRLPEGWEDALDWIGRGCALGTLGAFHLASGELAEADRVLARAMALFERVGYAHGRQVPLALQARVALQRGQADRALELLEPEGPWAPDDLYAMPLRLVHARALDLAGREGAVAAFADLARDARAAEVVPTAILALLHGAAARLRAGDRAGARAWRDEARALIAGRDDAARFEREAAPLQALAALDDAPEAGEAAPAGRLEIRLLGPFEVRLDGLVLDAWPRRQAKLVLAALALAPQGWHVGDLADLLGEGDGKVASAQACVGALRKLFEPRAAAGRRERFVASDGPRYHLVAERVALVDVLACRAALDEGQRLAGTDAAAAQQAFTEACELYRGHLLDEPYFTAFFGPEREALRQQVLAALLWLVARHVFLGEEARAGALLDRAARLGPCDEAVALAGLGHHGLRRNAVAVRATYWDHRKALHRDLAQTPSPAVEAAFREALARAEGKRP